MIEIKVEELDDRSKADVIEAAVIVERIVAWCQRGNYVEGYRNNIAVDLCSALYVLGYEDDTNWDEFFNEYCTKSPRDKSDFGLRSMTLNDYVSRWYDDGEIFDKMLLCNIWLGIERAEKLFAIV